MGYAAGTGLSKSEDSALESVIPIIVFSGIAMYNVLELNFIIFATFKTRKGLYFWSFLIATNAIPIYTIGFLLKNLSLSSASIYLAFIELGWVPMITGQSVVLYSRLHLVLRNPFHLRLVLTMIIVDAFIFHIPTIIFTCGSNSSNPDPWTGLYAVYEKIQVSGFFIQELIISGLYIKNSFSFFQGQDALHGKAVRKMRHHLIWVNVLIIILDVTILGLEYANEYDVQIMYKAFVYSVKLKLEFSILNSLVEMTRQRTNSDNGYGISSHHRTNGGVHLETFNGEKRNRGSLHGRKNGSGVGYNAFVKIGDENDISAKPGEGIIVTTATKVVHDIRADAESERDMESMDATTGRTSPGKHLRASPSSSSSEVQFATRY